MKLEGIQEALQRFANLPGKVQRKHARRGMTKAGRKMVQAAKANCPIATGTLRNSIGMKVYTAKSDQQISCLVGPRRRLAKVETTSGKTKIVKLKKGQKASDIGGERVYPTMYAHFAEFGTSRVPAHPFLRPAFDTTKDTAMADIVQAYKEGIEQELRQ